MKKVLLVLVLLTSFIFASNKFVKTYKIESIDNVAGMYKAVLDSIKKNKKLDYTFDDNFFIVVTDEKTHEDLNEILKNIKTHFQKQILINFEFYTIESKEKLRFEDIDDKFIHSKKIVNFSNNKLITYNNIEIFNSLTKNIENFSLKVKPHYLTENILLEYEIKNNTLDTSEIISQSINLKNNKKILVSMKKLDNKPLYRLIYIKASVLK